VTLRRRRQQRREGEYEPTDDNMFDLRSQGQKKWRPEITHQVQHRLNVRTKLQIQPAAKR